MKIIRELIKRQTIEEFAVEHDLVMKIVERSTTSSPVQDRFFCHFEHIEEKDGSCLISASGNGNTEQEAINDYAKRISEKYLVYNAYKDDRRTIMAPCLIENTRSSNV